MKDIIKYNSHFPLIVAAFTSILATILVIYAFLAAPVADDWVYYNYYTDGFMDYLEAAMGHTGRLLQWMIVFLGYKFFGLALATRVVPLLLYAAFIASIWWFLQVANFIKKGWAINLVVAVLIASVSLFLVPSVFDTYLWLTSSTVYLSSMAAVFTTVTLVLIMATRKSGWFFKAVALIIIALGQTLSEPTSAFLIGATGLALVVCAIHRRWDKVRALIAPFVALVAGFLIVYLSAGSLSRRSTESQFSFSRVFIESFESYGMLFEGWRLWVLLGLVLFGVVLLFASSARQNLKPLHLLLLSVGSFLFTTYPVFALNNYTQDYTPWRVLSLPTLGVVMSIFFMSLFIAAQWPQAIKRRRSVLTMIVVLLMLFSLPTIFRVSSKITYSLSIRHSISRYRDETVDEQIREGARPVVINAAPVYVRSNAADFSYGAGPWDKNGRGWVVNSYLEYKGIVASADEVTIVDPPGFYRPY